MFHATILPFPGLPTCRVRPPRHAGVPRPPVPGCRVRPCRAESVLESISRVVFDELGLPPPDLQAWVGDKNEIIGRADFLWRAYRTVGEADGALKYADPARAIAQLERDARLRAAGFEVVHFTWRDITRQPDQVAATIKTAFQRGVTR